MRFAALALSVLLHPLWMPTIMLVLCFGVDPHLSFTFTKEGLLIIYGMVFVMTALFPLTSAVMLLRSGVLSSLSLPVRRERFAPFLLTLMYYALCYYLLRRTPNHPVTWSLFLGAGIALLLTLLITLRWKISAHMVGIGGLVGALLAVLLVHGAYAPLTLCAVLVLAGLLGTARLLTSDHTPAQIYAGAALGIACVMGSAMLGIAL